jgi:hypothetical protein
MASTPPLLLADSVTRGAHLFNVTARVYEDRLRFTGIFDAAELLPVLLFSVGVPWVEPCVKNVCCLWEMGNRYKDNDLLSAIGERCDEHMNFTGRRLMKGSVVTSPADTATLKQWDLTTRIHPNFVIMLFVCLAPVFYMYYERVPVQWIERGSVTWSAAWYGDLCHTVTYPDGREVCIHCSNPKPQHSTYVFSADWFQTFECRWVCDSGYTGPNCEVALDAAIYAGGSMFVVMCITGMILVAMYGRTLGGGRVVGGKGKKEPLGEEMTIESGISSTATSSVSIVQPRAPAQVAMRSEVISFRDNSAINEIRIKLL